MEAASAITAETVAAAKGMDVETDPAEIADAKNPFGINYGLVFSAWGVGGFMLSKFAGWVYDGKIVEAWKDSFEFAYYTSALLLIVAAVVTFLVKAPHHMEEAATAEADA